MRVDCKTQSELDAALAAGHYPDLRGDGNFCVVGKVSVDAFERVIVCAFGSVTVNAYDDVRVHAFDDVAVEGYDRVHVWAYERVRAYTHDGARVSKGNNFVGTIRSL